MDRERSTQYAVVIPAYNEEATIFAVARETLQHIEQVIVVDDGSTDRTKQVLQDLPVTILQNDTNCGKAASLWKGFQYAQQLGITSVVTLDGDGQHSPEDIPRLIKQAELTPDRIIIGARRRPWTRHTWHRIIANRIADFWVSWAAGHPIADSQSGFRIYPMSLIAGLTIPTGRERSFVFESEVLVEGAKLGFWSLPVPIESDPRQAPRPSYFQPVMDIARITLMIAGKLLAKGLAPRNLYHAIFGQPLAQQRPNLQDAASSQPSHR
jgi:glycosyltransferase involved in cell wall biosynthesis